MRGMLSNLFLGAAKSRLGELIEETVGGIAGRVVRANGRWYFITKWAGQTFRYVFDMAAMEYPKAGPAVLYGGIGTNGLAAVVQHGKAVGWFRADNRAAPTARTA